MKITQRIANEGGKMMNVRYKSRTLGHEITAKGFHAPFMTYIRFGRREVAHIDDFRRLYRRIGGV